MKAFLARWLIGTVAVLVATYVVPGVHYRHWTDLLVATFILGLLNTFVRPLLVLLSLPLVLVTLGLFTLVINAVLLLLVSALMGPAFQVDGFWQAILAAVVISLVTLALNKLTGTSTSRLSVRVSRRDREANWHDGDDDGPVIDI
jgi:putative membrane protein